MSGATRGGDSSRDESADPRSRRERRRPVRLDELPEEQLESVRRAVVGALSSRAGDLAQLHQLSDPRRKIREVAALGRLSYWLEIGEVRVPDRIAREVMAEIAGEIEEMDAELLEQYEQAVAGHRALHTFVALLEGGKVRAMAEPRGARVAPVEPGRVGPISDTQVLAAVARAELHGESGAIGGGLHPNFEDLALQLGWRYTAASTRRLRPLLTGLLEAGQLGCEAPDPHRPANCRWVLTRRGRRRLAVAGPVSLPESPQHRRWRHAEEEARKALDEGVREKARAAALAAGELLEDDGPGGGLRDHERRRAVTQRYAGAASALAAALGVLDEWPEPDEDSRDTHEVEPRGSLRRFLHFEVSG